MSRTAWSPVGSRHLGKSTRRLDDRRHVIGAGDFVSDRIDHRTLMAQFVRSPVAHGELLGIDVDAAAQAPGVIAVLTASDLDLPDLPPPHGMSRQDVSRPVLARDKVRYVGEPIAVVIAESAALAADAAQMVWPEIADLPAVFDTTDQHDSPRLFDGPNVLLDETVGSDELEPSGLPIRVEVIVHNQRVAAVALDGAAIICEPQSEGRLRVTVGHQAPHRQRGQLAATLGMEPAQLHLVVPDVGGAFGLKGMYFPEYAAVAEASRRLNRPVAWIEARREHLGSGMHGRDQVHRVVLEGDAEGRVRRAHIDITADVGAYPQSGAIIPTLSRFVAIGLYDVEEVTVDTSIVVTNKAPTASYRGAGRPEAAYAIERAMDEFALAAGLTPEETRRRNFVTPAQMPYETTTGAVYDSGDYPSALASAVVAADVASLRREQARRLESGRDPLGIGIGAFIERTGGAADSGEYGKVSLDADGQLTVRTGSVDSGQGHHTVWAQVLSEVFDVPPESVRHVAGDTDEVAQGVGTYASRSAQVGASAAFRMAWSVREKISEVAGSALEASPADLVFENGAVHVIGSPETAIGLPELAGHAYNMGVSVEADEMFVPGSQAFPYGVHIAVVEVSLETGLVDLKRLVSVDDCGHVLNPMIVAGQMHGSLAQGLGQALFEEVVYSPDGTPMTTTMMDYLIPNASNVPEIMMSRLETPAPNNPLGVKGTGEAGCIGAPPAIVNATLDALRPYGVSHLEMPLTPHRVWSALRAAQAEKS